MILLIPVACTKRRRDGREAEETQADEDNPGRPANQPGKKEIPLLSAFLSLTNTSKPFFNERWPRDAVKWRERTPDMKFISVMKQILMFVFLFLFFQAVIEGEESIWYYCLDGVWDPGLNLHFFASSIVSISALIITRIFLHRILFLVGRIVNARGETICHLLDSMANYVLFTAGIFICLANLGVSATTLSLTGGIAGVVFGIGAQNVVNDILSGILMVFEGVVQVGELGFLQ